MKLVYQFPVNGISRFSLLLAVILLNACSDGMDDLRQYVAETKGKYQGSVEPLPQFEPYRSHEYAVSKLRPPFTEPTVAESAQDTSGGPSPDIQRRKEPLEFFPLDALRMVGTLEQQGQVWGLIQDPEGTIHRIRPGNYAGQNFGEIIRINEEKIDLLEIIPDGLGAWIEREVSLNLSEQ